MKAKHCRMSILDVLLRINTHISYLKTMVYGRWTLSTSTWNIIFIYGSVTAMLLELKWKFIKTVNAENTLENIGVFLLTYPQKCVTFVLLSWFVSLKSMNKRHIEHTLQDTLNIKKHQNRFRTRIIYKSRCILRGVWQLS